MRNTILVVEDSPEDFEAIERALRHEGLANPIARCTDGDDALDYVFRRGAYAGADAPPRPLLILLDLNLPGTDGHEVLREIKGDRELREIPVIVLTTSGNPRDVESSYRDGANGYVKKPVNLDAFLEALRRLKAYWLETSLLPGTG